MTAYPDVTIVIPNYNGNRLLRRNLPAVRTAAERYPGRCDVVLVDDASTEPGVAEVAAAFPGLRLIRRERNGGFAAAVASGVAAAGTDVLVLLNSDVAPEPDFLEPLIAALADDVFAVSPLILHEDGEPYRESWNRARFTRGRLREQPWRLEQLESARTPLPTLYTSGGSMAVRRAHFLALDGFADLYAPFYVEDLDLGVRAWRAGLRVLTEPRSRVVHQEGGAIASHHVRRRIKCVQHRNRLLFEWSHLPARWLPAAALHTLRRFAGRLLRGDGAYVQGVWLALRALPAVRAHRARVARQARRSLAEVIAAIEAGVAPVTQKNGPVPGP